MEKKKYIVYYNDGVNEPADVFSADTAEECKSWIAEQLKGEIPVDDEHPCSEKVFDSASTFFYEVYEGEPIVETQDGESEFKDACYTSGYYYTPKYI